MYSVSNVRSDGNNTRTEAEYSRKRKNVDEAPRDGVSSPQNWIRMSHILLGWISRCISHLLPIFLSLS